MDSSTIKTISTLDDLRALRRSLPGPVGFVPTMGFLHAGHLRLVQTARRDCQSVVASIFVNPAQFGPQEDLSRYPRDLPRDLVLLEEAGVDLVWLPTPEIMYPPGYQTWVTVDEVSQPLEGASRPGHFRGVATVVAKLFNAVQPDRAYFGQKDAQQAAVIAHMIRDLNFPLEMVVCPTVREADGLAMSSRNTYLSPAERQAAVVLYQALCAMRQAYEQGERDAGHLRQAMQRILDREPLAQPQYVSCADGDSLQELEGPVTQALFSLAVYVGKTRLIDNFILRDGTWLVGEKN
jgi:pantoate--beta-alanine ligase